MNEKYKKTCKYLNYVEHLFILASVITGFISISAFTSLVCVPVGITSSAVGRKIYAITLGTKKCKSIINKNSEKVLLGKSRLNPIEVLIYKFLIDPYYSHDEFISIYNELREYNEIKEEMSPPVEHTI